MAIMAFARIEKNSQSFRVAPNLIDYERACAAFSWTGAAHELHGADDHQNWNIAYHAVERHAAGPHALHLALRWLGKQGEVLDYTYADLQRLTNRFANALRAIGIGKGDRVFVLAGRIPELYITALGTLKNGSVFCPLFSAFGPEPIEQRLAIGEGNVLVTTEALYHRRKIAEVRRSLPALKHVLVIGAGDMTAPAGTENFHEVMHNAGESFATEPTAAEDMALIHFTSGTTGKPKGAVHVHKAVLAHHMTGKYALDFHPGDIFWCTADPGWVTGTSYGIISPLTHGITSIIDEADFDAERWYRIIEEQKVSIWYTAPTAVRMMMKAGAAIVRKCNDGTVAELGAEEVGELALRPGWPSMFRAYLHEQERYRKCFAGGWYLTGDLAKKDADGYYWFIGRADDVIKSAGHLIGPFEVESALMEHPAIAEAGVIDKPDALIGETVKAFVALKKGFVASDSLRRELLGRARARLGPAVAPREIEFRDSVPKTRSGKIMRRLLKARELGLPEGDLSTLESD
jgi:acetyl-CoA synthetase